MLIKDGKVIGVVAQKDEAVENPSKQRIFTKQERLQEYLRF
jgi:hypothetical protein